VTFSGQDLRETSRIAPLMRKKDTGVWKGIETVVKPSRPTAKALSEAREFARRMSRNEVSNDEFWSRCIAQGFYIPFSEVPLSIDDDLYLIEDDIAPERYSELESGVPPSAEELRKWTDAWIQSRLENPVDHDTKSIDILRFSASDGWTGVLMLGSHTSLFETPEFGAAGLYASFEEAVADLRRSGHLKI
jgi:hypothetical protein